MNTRISCTREDFTSKELEILDLLSHGKTWKVIAHELHLTRNTVNTHQKHIYQKMNAHTTHQAVAYAFRDGLIV
jgi:DNA-binding NarL/FixJ family response regulator